MDGSGRGAHRDVVLTWAMWAALLVAMAVTYTRLEVSDLYNVSRSGLSGALSRVLVQINYPIALVAIAAILLAVDALGARWWRLGAPGIVACAVVVWPGVVDDSDLDAKVVNAAPALGVAVALALTFVVARRHGLAGVRRCRFDPARVVLAAVVVFLSLPWLVADLGFYLPEGLFITERGIVGSDGVTKPAVHLGHHHGLDGTFLFLSALLLSRVPVGAGRLGRAVTGYVALMGSYGLVNFAQDYWHEQIQKRDWVDWTFPKAVEPSLELVWAAILLVAVGSYLLLGSERDEASTRTLS